MSEAKNHGGKSLRLVRTTKLPLSGHQIKVKNCSLSRTGGHLKNLGKHWLFQQNLDSSSGKTLGIDNYNYWQLPNMSETLFRPKRFNFQANGRSTSSESYFYCKQS
ncbi:MAG: hypothetical protein SAK42_05970 [Oscillatoria sp. PMC 1076.18]|nr:hypothetical protein [Oscillatoria sp. PMC 1076.18]